MGDVGGVFERVRRDKRIANLLYGLLGWEDESDPQAAIADLARVARAELGAASPAYRIRVAEAAALLIELVQVVSAGGDPERAFVELGRRVAPAGGTVIELGPAGEVYELPEGLRMPGDPPSVFEADVDGFTIEDTCDEDD